MVEYAPIEIKRAVFEGEPEPVPFLESKKKIKYNIIQLLGKM